MNNNLPNKRTLNGYFCGILEIIKNVGLTELSTGFGLLSTKLNASDRGEYAIFLGAGASLGSGGKLGDQIALKFAKELCGKADIDINKTEDAEILKKWFRTTWDAKLSFTSAMETIGTKAEMKDFMAKELKGMEPSVGYKCLAKLITENYFQIIFTTNFDRMIEDALIEKGLVEREDFSVNIVGVTEVAAIRENLDSHSPRIKILKLHGDIGYASTMKCTSKETEELPEEIENIFDGFLKKKGIIFVGYGGLDEGILGILEKQTKDSGSILRRKRAPAERSVWWVSPHGFVTEHEYMDILLGFLRARGSLHNVIKDVLKDSQVIPFGDFDTFFVILCEELLGGCLRLSSDEILAKISNAITRKNYSYLFRYMELLESEEGDILFSETKIPYRVFENIKILIDEYEKTDLNILLNVFSLLQKRWNYFQKYLNTLSTYRAIDNVSKILEASTYCLKNIFMIPKLDNSKRTFIIILTVVSNLLRFYNNASLSVNNEKSINKNDAPYQSLFMSLQDFDRSLREILNLFKDKIVNPKRYTKTEKYEKSELRLSLNIFLYSLLTSPITQLIYYYDDKEQALRGTVGFFSELSDCLSSVSEQYRIDYGLTEEEKQIPEDVASQIYALQRNIKVIQKQSLDKWCGGLYEK